MNNAGVFAVWTRGRNFLMIAAGMADEVIAVGMESEGQKTAWTEGLPATFFTDSKGRGAATIMEN